MAKVVWTVCLVGCNRNIILKLLGCFVLVGDALILKNFVYYFFGLIKVILFKNKFKDKIKY